MNATSVRGDPDAVKMFKLADFASTDRQGCVYAFSQKRAHEYLGLRFRALNDTLADTLHSLRAHGVLDNPLFTSDDVIGEIETTMMDEDDDERCDGGPYKYSRRKTDGVIGTENMSRGARLSFMEPGAARQRPSRSAARLAAERDGLCQ